MSQTETGDQRSPATAELLVGDHIFRSFHPLGGTEISCPSVCLLLCNRSACFTCFHITTDAAAAVTRNPAVLLYNQLGTATPWWALTFRFYDPLCGTEISCPIVCRILRNHRACFTYVSLHNRHCRYCINRLKNVWEMLLLRNCLLGMTAPS